MSAEVEADAVDGQREEDQDGIDVDLHLAKADELTSSMAAEEAMSYLIARRCPELGLQAYRLTIAPLVAQDKASETDLVRTLAACMAASSRAEAASLLQLHRNSLPPRLKRIRDIVGRDPFHRDDAFVMRIGLAALALWPQVTAVEMNTSNANTERGEGALEP